jgi:serine/threonine-protein kinase RsbW
MTTEPTGEQHAQISRDGSLENLPDLLRFVDNACRAAGLDGDTTFEIHLAVEEVCSNIILHGYGADRGGPIDLAFCSGEGRATVTIIDQARTFVPGDAPAADLESGWEERRIGGLGWHLAHSVMDEVTHRERPGGGNRLTLVKHLHSR